ncbi:MAG: dephospho-CoA kinase [Planctomycetota bacterium]|jgi:dephospho-CoA kinase
MSQKPVIGILGGIGSGKSTVAGAFADLGCVLIDADAIAHEVLDEPDVLDALSERWGPEVMDSAGRADHQKIAETVFDSLEELDFLNGLIHPRVLERAEVILKACQMDANAAGIVLDMPLLLEVGWEKKCDFLVFVDCSEEKRAERIAKNGRIDLEQLKKRENFQISLDKKKEKAHYGVHNNNDKSDITEQIAQIFSSMTGSK